MTIELFRSLSDTLDQLVLKVDRDLPLADDIHPAIHKVGEYAADMVRLPATLAKLEAQKASVDASLPAREDAIRKAKHTVTVLETKLRKLGESIDRNRAAAANEAPAPAIKPAPAVLGLKLPASRQEIVEGLHKEYLAVDDELNTARDTVKKAEQTRKGFITRAANLAKQIDATKKAVVDHAGRLEETIKVLRKTINHLRNRQEKRDTKRAAKTETVTVDETPDEAPKGPTDEDIRKMAASQGLPIDCPADLEAARQLFLN